MAIGTGASRLIARVSSATSRGSPTLRANKTTLRTPRLVSSASSGLGASPRKPTQKRRAARASRAEGMESVYHCRPFRLEHARAFVPHPWHFDARIRSVLGRRKPLRVLNSCYAAVLCEFRGDRVLVDPAAHGDWGSRRKRPRRVVFRGFGRVADRCVRRGDEHPPLARGEAAGP